MPGTDPAQVPGTGLVLVLGIELLDMLVLGTEVLISGRGKDK